MITFIGLEAGQ